ncbi:conserved hypothetical protein [Theileria equi strain WA]|uniref:Mitotic-spindle organizing protein 1 n=1 Tax=Theileria equi strain WA TaxID=1537102 RepID=L1LD76_THEEQ|nr:conserved hypothetical protein [Theileria equi strain WA]EKX73276.1 conserved hypothetical protein [Theileria equi strain WA]|eukprot:XP_004832728.1 conserved hypothetical protein [Theileria equi strain WA]
MDYSKYSSKISAEKAQKWVESEENGKAQENLPDLIHQISKLLDTGLDREFLNLLVKLCKQGVNPNALVHILRRLMHKRHAFLSNSEG